MTLHIILERMYHNGAFEDEFKDSQEEGDIITRLYDEEIELLHMLRK